MLWGGVPSAWRLGLGEHGFRFSDFPMLPGYPNIPDLIFAHQGQTSLQYASSLISTLLTIAIESPGFNIGRTPLLSSPAEVSEVTSMLHLVQWTPSISNIANFPALARRPGACLPDPTPASGEVASSLQQQCSLPTVFQAGQTS